MLCYGERKLFEMVNIEDGKLNGLLFKVEVVVLLLDNDEVKWWSFNKIVGEVFFGLFLGVEIGFLVYVNGYFVVMINCCSLWEDMKESLLLRKLIEVFWN